MPEPGLGVYVREAFKVPYNVILLVGGILAGVVSLQPFLVWPLVAAAEIVYLSSMSSNPRFQAVVRARRRARGAADSLDAGLRARALLGAPRQARFDRLLARCRELQGQTPADDEDRVAGVLQSQQTQAVNQLLWAFLRTLIHEQALATLCESTSPGDLEKAIANIEKQIAAPGPSESVQAAHRENLDVLRQRLDNLLRARQNLEALGARLERIENSIMLVQEQALSSRDASFLEVEVKSVTQGLSSVEEMMRSMNLPPVETGRDDAIPEFVRSGGPAIEQGSRK